MLASTAQQNGSAIYVYLFPFELPSHLVHHRALTRVPLLYSIFPSVVYFMLLLLLFSCLVSDSFVTSWTVTHQAPLSMRFPRQEYWNELPILSPGDLHNPGIKPALAGGFFTTEPPGKPLSILYKVSIVYMCQSQAPPTPPILPLVSMFVLYVCVSVSVLQIRWSIPFF